MSLMSCINVKNLIYCATIYNVRRGRGNGIVVSVSICQVGLPGSSPVRSAYFRKVVCYQNVINLSPPEMTTGSSKRYYVYVIL